MSENHTEMGSKRVPLPSHPACPTTYTYIHTNKSEVLNSLQMESWAGTRV